VTAQSEFKHYAFIIGDVDEDTPDAPAFVEGTLDGDLEIEQHATITTAYTIQIPEDFDITKPLGTLIANDPDRDDRVTLELVALDTTNLDDFGILSGANPNRVATIGDFMKIEDNQLFFTRTLNYEDAANNDEPAGIRRYRLELRSSSVGDSPRHAEVTLTFVVGNVDESMPMFTFTDPDDDSALTGTADSPYDYDATGEEAGTTLFSYAYSDDTDRGHTYGDLELDVMHTDDSEANDRFTFGNDDVIVTTPSELINGVYTFTFTLPANNDDEDYSDATGTFVVEVAGATPAGPMPPTDPAYTVFTGDISTLSVMGMVMDDADTLLMPESAEGGNRLITLASRGSNPTIAITEQASYMLDGTKSVIAENQPFMLKASASDGDPDTLMVADGVMFDFDDRGKTPDLYSVTYRATHNQAGEDLMSESVTFFIAVDPIVDEEPTRFELQVNSALAEGDIRVSGGRYKYLVSDDIAYADADKPVLLNSFMLISGDYVLNDDGDEYVRDDAPAATYMQVKLDSVDGDGARTAITPPFLLYDETGGGLVLQRALTTDDRRNYILTLKATLTGTEITKNFEVAFSVVDPDANAIPIQPTFAVASAASASVAMITTKDGFDASFTIVEDIPVNTMIGMLSSSDADGDDITYEITSITPYDKDGMEVTLTPAESNRFSLDTDTVKVTLAFDAENSDGVAGYSVKVTAADEEDASEATTLSFDIKDVNDNNPTTPTFTATEGLTATATSITIPEDYATDRNIATLMATDADVSDEVSFEVSVSSVARSGGTKTPISSNPPFVAVKGGNSYFLRVASANVLDYDAEDAPRMYELSIKSSDGSKESSDSLTLTINLSNVNEHTPTLSATAAGDRFKYDVGDHNDDDAATYDILESHPQDLGIVALVPSDEDADADLTLKISEVIITGQYGTANSSTGNEFAIKEGIGDVADSLVSKVDFDFEDNSRRVYTVVLVVADGTGDDAKMAMDSVEINITNDAADGDVILPIASLSSAEGVENDTEKIVIGDLIARSGNSDTLKSVVLGGDDADVFELIDPRSSGQITDLANFGDVPDTTITLTLQTKAGIDLDVANPKTSYSIDVTVTDRGMKDNMRTFPFTIKITTENDEIPTRPTSFMKLPNAPLIVDNSKADTVIYAINKDVSAKVGLFTMTTTDGDLPADDKLMLRIKGVQSVTLGSDNELDADDAVADVAEAMWPVVVVPQSGTMATDTIKRRGGVVLSADAWYRIAVEAYDGDNASAKDTVFYLYINNKPSINITALVLSKPENEGSAVVFGDISATPADANTVFSLSGADAALFELVDTDPVAAGTKVLQSKAAGLDYENKASYAVVVEVNDGKPGGPTTQALTLMVTNVDDEKPTLSFAVESGSGLTGTAPTFTLASSAEAGDLGTFSATDPDNIDGTTFTYDLKTLTSYTTTSGTDGATVVPAGDGRHFTVDGDKLKRSGAVIAETVKRFVMVLTVSDGTNTSDEVTYTINISVLPTLSALTTDLAISIYPNPVEDRLYVKGIGAAQVEVYNLKGELLMQTYSPMVNVSILPQGYYLLLVRNAEGVAKVEPFVKK
jgi:hypothetical protein